MTDHLVLRIIGKLMIPLILLYGLYVQAHGDFGPGGGFQAGVIFAAGVILYGLIFGVDEMRRVIPDRLVEVLAATGILLYGGVGIAALFAGGSYLGYGAFDHHHPAHGQHIGVMLVEIGVGVTVASVMLIIFYVFASHEPADDAPAADTPADQERS
jgi:multicomponent Na+:H+ antiporter subunit B